MLPSLVLPATWRPHRRRSPFVAVATVLALLAAIVTAVLMTPDTAQAAAAPLVGAASGRCLDVKGGDSTAGTMLDIYDCNSRFGQGFEFTSSGQLQTLGGTRCVDASHQQSTPGTVGTLRNGRMSDPDRRWIFTACVTCGKSRPRPVTVSIRTEWVSRRPCPVSWS